MTADPTAEERRVERVVREHFYPGPMAGSTERLAKALEEEFGITALQAAEQECERLKGEISLLVACMDVQQDAFTEGYNKGQAKAEDKFVALKLALEAIQLRAKSADLADPLDPPIQFAAIHSLAFVALRAPLSAVPPSQGVEKPEWRAIETAPRDGQSILLICRDAYTPTSFEGWWFDGAWVHYARPEEKLSGGVRKWFPTHWMPKPGVAAPEPRSGDVVGWRMTNFESDTYFFSSNENVEFWKAAGHTAEPLYLAASPVQGGAL